MPIYTIDFTGMRPYEAAAEVMSIIAWPSPKDAIRRGRTCELLCGWFAREILVLGAKHGFDPDPLIRASHAAIDRQEIAAANRKLHAIMKRRLQAALIAIAIFQGVAEEAPLKTPEGLSRRTLEEVISFAAEKFGAELDSPRERINEDNIRKRVWREALPVAHIVAAWAVRTQDTIRAGQSPPDLLGIMSNLQNLLDILAEAERYEAYFDRAPATRQSAAALVRIRNGRQGSALV